MNTLNKKSAKSFLGNLYKVVTILAPFGFILSIAFFLVQFNKSTKLVGNLTHIEQSLSTRHIGIFPDYLDEINQLLAETPYSPKDTTKVIIFEDVLFYGAFYNGDAFKEMIKRLAELSSKGKKIAIAYYDNTIDMRNGRMFREVVQESWMRQKDLRRLIEDRRLLIDSLQATNLPRRQRFLTADSIASEKYFVVYRDGDRNDFTKRVEKILAPLYDAARNDYSLFQKIDEIKANCLNKPVNTISFNNIYTMCQVVTDILKVFFEQHNVKLIPLNNYLSMSCWSNGERVLFAFPGRFAADEIGFISHDPAILRYIDTMLAGIESTGKDNNE
jgi:hypothetical protein